MFRARLAFLLFYLMPLAGCGYHTVDSAVHLPKTVHTLAVPTFHNSTQSCHTEVSFTQAVIREFTNRTSYHVMTGENKDADATLQGTIRTFQITPLTYNNTTGESSSFLITINASIKILDRNQKVIYENGSYTFRQQYEETQNLASFIQEDSPAVARLSKDFARAVVSDILESF